jgi:hypothetical protein
MPSAKPPRKSGLRENAALGADWDKESVRLNDGGRAENTGCHRCAPRTE